jgi:hypothetical protein
MQTNWDHCRTKASAHDRRIPLRLVRMIFSVTMLLATTPFHDVSRADTRLSTHRPQVAQRPPRPSLSDNTGRVIPAKSSPGLGSSPKKKKPKAKRIALWRRHHSKILRLLLGLAIAWALGLWHREKTRSKSPHSPLAPILKQARVQAPTGPLKVDPAAFESNDVIINESARAVIIATLDPQSPDADLHEEETSEELDLFAPEDSGTRAQISRSLDSMIGEYRNLVKSAKQPPEPGKVLSIRRKAPTLRLPVPLEGHFEGRFGETLMWNRPLDTTMTESGWVAVTNQRVLILFQRKKLRLAPIPIVTETERKQIQLASITHTELERIRIPPFLGVAALTFLWYPVGTLIAAPCLALFLLVRKSILRIHTPDQTLDLPIIPVDQREALKFLAPIQDTQNNHKNQPPTAKGPWGNAQ